MACEMRFANLSNFAELVATDLPYYTSRETLRSGLDAISRNKLLI